MAKKKQTGRDLLDQYKQETGYGISRQSSSGNTNGQALLDDYLRNGGGQNVKNGPYNPDYRTSTKKATPQSYEAAYQQYKQIADSINHDQLSGYLRTMQERQNQIIGSINHDQMSGYRRTLQEKERQQQRKVQTGTAAQKAATNAGQDYSRLIGLNQFDGELERRAAEQEKRYRETVLPDQLRGMKRTSAEMQKQLDQLYEQKSDEHFRDYQFDENGTAWYTDENGTRRQARGVMDIQSEIDTLETQKAALDSTRALGQAENAVGTLDTETRNLLKDINGTNLLKKTDAKHRLQQKGYSEDQIGRLAEYEKYLEDFEDYQMRMSGAQQFGQDAPVFSTVTSSMMAPFKALGNIESLRGILPKGLGGYQNADMPTNIYSPMYAATHVSSGIRSGVMEGMGPVGQFLYQAGTSALDSAVNMAVSTALVGTTGLSGEAASSAVAETMNWVMGSQVAADSVYEGIQRGKSNQEALIDGIVEGAIEGFTEKYSVGDIIETMLSGKQVWKKALRAFASEGAEEIASNWLNRIYDVAAKHDRGEVMGAYAEYLSKGNTKEKALALTLADMLKEDGLSFLAGGISGLAMSGAYAGTNKLTEAYNKGEQLNVIGQVMDAVESMAKERGDQATAEAAQAVMEKVNAGQMPDTAEVQAVIDAAAKADQAAQEEAAFQTYNQYADERDARQAAREAQQQGTMQAAQEAAMPQQKAAQTVIQEDTERGTEQYGQQEASRRNGEGRTESVYSGGQSRRMGAGSEIERTLERQGETVRLRNRARDLGAENISPAEAGLKGGDTTKSLLKIPVEAYGEHEKALQKAVEARGASLNIVMGRIRLANGTAVDEFIDTGTRQITVRADCTKWAMENLIDHALFHDLSTEQRNAAAQAVADRFSESELMAIAGQYVKRMRGVYEGMSEEALFNIATEEVLADAAGRMLRYTDADATKFTETVRAILGESIAEPDAEKPTKNQRYSISDRLGEDLRKVFDGTYKAESGEVYIGETSNFLTDVIGADALHVTMPANKAYSAMATEAQAKKDGRYRQNVNYHGLGADGLQRVLNASENPVAAFADTAGANGKRASNIVLVTGEAGKGGPIVVIETLNTKGTLNGKRIDANKVITSYDRAALISDLEAAASDGRLLYLDKKRSQAALAGVPAANSLAAIQGGDFTTNIRNFIAGVKWEKSGASSYTSGAADGKTTFAKAYEEAQQKQRYSPADTETDAEAGTATEDAAKKAAAGVPIFNFDAKADWAYSSDPNPFYRLMGITPPGVRVGIVTQGARAADWAGNGKAYTKALLDFVTKPDRSTKTLTLQFPNADGTYRAETVQNTKFMQDVYKYYAETVPEGQRLDEATFWMMRRKLAEGSIPARIQAMSAEAKGQAWQESSRNDFKSTGALEKMGVKVERSVGRYGKTQTLIEMDKAFKQAKKEVNRAIDRLGATAKEVAFARQIADGVFDMQDIPQGFSKRVVLSLVDYMNAEAALGEDRLAAQRKSIRQDTTAVLETLFKDVKDNKVQDMFTLNHRTAQRNMLKIFGDETGEKINKAIFDPIKGNESERIRFINRQFDDVREFADSTGRKSELTHEESILVQLVMEGKATEALLGDMPGNPQITKAGLKIADGMKASEAAKSEHLNKNEKQLAKMYASWVGALRMMADGKIDAVKIDNAAKAYTQKYNEFYAAINDFLVAHGYEPIGFIQNYAPHMQSEESRGALDSALKALGLNEDTVTLPTSIAGLTANFKPNKRWNPYFLHRTSETYNFDAAKGFESYVAYMSEVFYHTDDIMTVRALSDYLRRRYSSEDISFDIDRYTWLREKLPDEQLLYLQQEGKLPHGTIADQAELDTMIEAELDKLYEDAKNKSTYSNLVVWLDNYANILAGKQTMGDRSTEADFGRKALNFGNRLTRGFGAAKVAGNIATILNQTAQLPVIVAEKGVRNTAAAVKDMVTGQLRKADFAMESDYLTSKKGVHFLVTDEKNMYEWALDKVGQAQEFADAMVSTIAVRAAYLEGIQKGMTHEQAMRYADKYGAAVMGDRSKGAKPVAFNSKSPVMQLVNTFQLEVANSWEHLTQDTAGFDFRMMAKKYGKDKAIKALAGVIVKYLIAAFIMNRLSDETYGGTPAQFDVLGITSNFVASGYGLPVNDALRTVMDDGWEKLTGERLFGTENEERSFDGWKALEAAGGDIANDIPYLQNASALIGWGDNSLPAAIPTKALDKWINAVKGGKSAQDIAKATFDVGTEMIPGGSQIKKTARGIDAMLRGGVYQGYGEQTKLRYPVDNKNIGKWIQAVVFGPNGLSETGRYYAGEERAIGEKQTTAYQAMIAAGADKEESYRLIRRISKLGDGEDSKLDKLNMLLSSKVSTAGQGAYYYLMMAGDKERERIDALTGENGVLGMDEYLKASQKKLQIDADESMKASEKADAFRQWANQQGYSAAQKRGVLDAFKFAQIIMEGGGHTELYQAATEGVSEYETLRADAIAAEMAGGKTKAQAESSVNSSLRSQMKQDFQDGLADEETAAAFLKEYCGAEDEHDVYWTLEEWKGGEGWKKYGKFLDAVDKGVLADTRKVAREYMKHGVDKGDLSSQLTTHFKEAWLAATGDEATRLKNAYISAYKAIGGDADKARDNIIKWRQEANKRKGDKK
jgi:hypothetical protein|nr:MAG TPA: hypothetical protein [Bacteriophage sp.]